MVCGIGMGMATNTGGGMVADEETIPLGAAGCALVGEGAGVGALAVGGVVAPDGTCAWAVDTRAPVSANANRVRRSQDLLTLFLPVGALQEKQRQSRQE